MLDLIPGGQARRINGRTLMITKMVISFSLIPRATRPFLSDAVSFFSPAITADPDNTGRISTI